MKSTKCFECGFVSFSDAEHCKSCGAAFASRDFVKQDSVYATPDYSLNDASGPKKGLAIFALVLGIVSFLTFGLLGLGAVTGIIVAVVAMGKAKRDPWQYGGRGMAIAGLVLSIVSLVSAVPLGLIAAVAIPNIYAARMAANEGSAIHSLRTISSAESEFQERYQRYGTLEDLAMNNLIDSTLAKGSKNGYKFAVELTNRYPESTGFEVVGVPVSYQNSGRRSFFTDESMVIRAADNRGAPSTRDDSPLVSEFEYPSRSTQQREYRRDAGY